MYYMCYPDRNNMWSVPVMYFSILDTSTSDANFTMDTLIITNLTEDHHLSKSRMPALSWTNVGDPKPTQRISAKASLLSHQAYMISNCNQFILNG